MCAILDADVAHQVFGSNRPKAGEEFFNWINKERGLLVVGGKLLEELVKTRACKEWLQQALQAGRAMQCNNQKVNARAEELKNKGSCQSTDPHVIALGQISGARLLYSNDKGLHQDFTNKTLIDNPRGKVYSTLRSQGITPAHRWLLRREDLCCRTGK